MTFSLSRATANGGRCQTRDGRPARILATDLRDPEPLAVFIGADDPANERLERFMADGRYYPTPSGWDLINIPTKREGWVNVYPNGRLGSHVRDTREQSDNECGEERVACVRIEWEEP